jgi:hypothetical protein
MMRDHAVDDVAIGISGERVVHPFMHFLVDRVVISPVVVG